MFKVMITLFVLLSAATLLGDPSATSPQYPWLEKYDAKASVGARFAPPAGYQRLAVEQGSFAQWLRGLPLKPGCPAILRYDGFETDDQQSHVAVIDMGVGRRDLQQCADSIIRLRAEYLYSAGRMDDIHFRFTSGQAAAWRKWSAGERPTVRGGQVAWARSAARNESYTNFHAYLEVVFTYAGTRSLNAEMNDVPAGGEVEIGDVLVQAGSPGHAVIVVDIAKHSRTGKRVLLIAQGFMPAQEMHIVKNPGNRDLSPWYEADFSKPLQVPAWNFSREHLKRF